MSDGDLVLGSHAARGPDEFHFRTAAGTQIVGADSFRPAELALLEAADPAEDDDTLAVDGNYGVPGIVLGALTPDGATTVTETSARCANLIRDNARRNGVPLDVALVPAVRAVEQSFDLAVFAPRAYDPLEVVTERAFEALASLRPGSDMLLAGETESGTDRIADSLRESATVEQSQYLGVPVHRIERPDSLAVPRLVEDQVRTERLCGLERTFVTQPGLFSPDRVDEGTRHLLEAINATGDPTDGDRVLDLCCGYGAVGATLGGLADVALVLTDDDRRATECAERSLRRNAVEGQVYTADGLAEVDGPFDMIATNPPTHAGQKVTDALFAGAAKALSREGHLWVVYNEMLAYDDRLERWFDSVELMRTADSYAVARATHLPSKGTA